VEGAGGVEWQERPSTQEWSLRAQPSVPDGE
jgi:hypothetical protein